MKQTLEFKISTDLELKNVPYNLWSWWMFIKYLEFWHGPFWAKVRLSIAEKKVLVPDQYWSWTKKVYLTIKPSLWSSKACSSAFLKYIGILYIFISTSVLAIPTFEASSMFGYSDNKCWTFSFGSKVELLRGHVFHLTKYFSSSSS